MANGKPGRPKGLPKTGGRRKGSLNRRTADALAIADKFKMSPVEFLLAAFHNQLKDESGRPIDVPLPLRLDAAKSAAPYIHTRRPIEAQTVRTPPVTINIGLGPSDNEMKVIEGKVLEEEMAEDWDS